MSKFAEAEAALTQLNGTELMGSRILVQPSLAFKNRLSSQGATSQEVAAAGNAAAVASTVGAGVIGIGARNAAAAAAAASAASAPLASYGSSSHSATTAEAAAAAAAAGAARPEPPGGVKLYVQGLHASFGDAEVEAIFRPFGPLDGVHVQLDPLSGASKGYAFVSFRARADGAKCIEALDRMPLAGRPIRVSMAAAEPQVAHAAAPALPAYGRDAPDASLMSRLDGLDADSQNAKLGGATRASLHMKLARNAGLAVPEETRRAAAAAGFLKSSQHGGASDVGRCLVLKNLFDRLSDEAQSNPNYFEELAADVRSECAKLGTVLFVGADRWSNGFVYVKMLSSDDGARVIEKMHGRYFDKNKILASVVSEEQLAKKFGLAPFRRLVKCCDTDADTDTAVHRRRTIHVGTRACRLHIVRYRMRN